MQIDPNKMYSPREVTDQGLIVNSTGKPDYHFVLKLINRGVIGAKDYTFGKSRPQFKIIGSDIIKYKEIYEGYQDDKD